MRFHVLGIPHTISTPEYSSCAFTQKVVKLCAMLVMEGHTVFHYGAPGSVVEGEHVDVVSQNDLDASYPDHDWRKLGFPNFAQTDLVYQAFYLNTPGRIKQRAEPGDFLLCPFGDWHRPVAEQLPDLIAVESGIGYPNGTFAKFKVYESYAIMHAYQGNAAAISASNDFWYDAVIPNAFDPAQFKYRENKGNELLFLGRLNEGKGLHIATQLAIATKTNMIIAGPGTPPSPAPYTKYVGVVDPKQRRLLLSRAKAVICPSTFLEPFCGVQIEAMLSGTPVISSDRGAFAEYNIQGKTGFRCRTFEQFEWAVRNIDSIKPLDCRAWASRFSLAAIAPHYTDYFQSVKDIFGGKGWYEPRPDRTRIF